MRIGLLIKENKEIRNYEFRIIEYIKNIRDFELVLLIKDGRPNNTETKSVVSKFSRIFKKKNLIGQLIFSFQVYLEKSFLFKTKFTVNRYELIEYLDTIPKLYLDPKKKGNLDVFNKEQAQQVKSYNLDVLLRFEFGIIQGEILTTPKYGIWSFHHGDNSINRGGPAGFWEIVLKQPAIGVTLQQLTPEIDGGNVIDKAFYSMHWSYFKTNSMTKENSVNLLIKNLKKLNDGKFYPKKSLVYSNIIYVTPKIGATLKYIISFYKKFIAKIFERLLSNFGIRYSCWTLYIGKGDFLHTSLFKLMPVKLPKNEFWADPFLFKYQKEVYVFFENYSYKTKLGKISCGRIDNNKIVEVQDVLDLEYHLSFPFIFQESGDIYMMPETSQNKRLEIYKCVEFPTKWELFKTAFEGEIIKDAFFFDDKLSQKWLFLNKSSGPNTEVNSELFVYKVDSIQLNSIQPHKQNPVLIDARIARNGGSIFNLNGNIYRPSQNNTFGIYGRALNINKIEELSIDSYKEKKIITVEPSFRKGLERMHHLHQLDDIFIIDAAYKKKI